MQKNCNQCNKTYKSCTCSQVTLESCVSNLCIDKFDAKCIYYNWKNKFTSNLKCFIGVDGDTSLHDILEKLDKKLCNLIIDNIDEKVKTDSTDTNSGYLFDKITVGDCLIKVKSNNTVKIEIDWTCVCNKLNTLSCITNNNGGCTPQPQVPVLVTTSNNYCGSNTVTLTASNYNGTLQWYKNNIVIQGASQSTYVLLGEAGTYTVKNTTTCGVVSSNPIVITYNPSCNCTPQATTPSLTANKTTLNQGEQALLTATGCNGNLKWYNQVTGQEIANTGNTLLVSSGAYYVSCQTICNSVQSNIILIQNNTGNYTETKTVDFNRNNCGNNNCGIAGTGTNVTYSKTYNSIISAADLQTKIQLDTNNFNIEGQNNANTNGVCNYPEIGFPNYNLTSEQASCINGNIGTAKIIASNIINATSYDYKINSDTWVVNQAITGGGFTLTNLVNPTNQSGDIYTFIFYSNKNLHPNCYTLQTINIPHTNCDGGGNTCNINAVISNTAATCNNGNIQLGVIELTNITGLNTNNYYSYNGGANTAITGNSILIPNVPNENGTKTIKIITDNNCEKTYTVSTNKVNCNQADVLFEKDCVNNTFSINITNGVFGSNVRYCASSTFICSNTCIPGDGQIDINGNLTINGILLPPNNQSQIYTIRVYDPNSTTNNCSLYYDKTITITNNCISCASFKIMNVSTNC